MTSASVAPFDPCAELPAGTLAIEASAGTGKTYALASLATRFLAEGTVDAGGLLLVTFTRAASGELRSRVRDRIVDAATHLVDADESPPQTSDPLFEWLAQDDSGHCNAATRRANLDRAVGEFDAATITTIHGFASSVLGALGLGAGVDADVRFVDDTTERILEVCSDVMTRAALDPALCAHLPTWDTFVKRTRGALQAPDIVVVPHADQAGVSDEHRVLAHLVRQAVVLLRERRVESGTQTFEDLLTRLRAALRSAGGAAAIASVRRRFDLALVDEFQDTDPVQWEIFETLFGTPGAAAKSTSLVLVGDPKQAIYSFRGADVHTFVTAIRSSPAETRRALATNWRSNDAMIDAVDTLFTGTSFGEGIAFSPVAPAGPQNGKRLERDGSPIAPLQVRCATGTDLVGSDPSSDVKAGAARSAIFADLADHAVGLLRHGRLPDEGHEASSGSRRLVRPSDIAVLVRTRDDAQRVQSVLVEQGVPAVLARGASVLDSPAAEQVRWLLEAMVRPSDQRRARTYAVSWFGGHDLQWLDSPDDRLIADIQEQLHRWNAVVTAKGVVELLRTVWDETEVIGRLLDRPDGDRNVTDLDHVGEVLHLGAGAGPVSAASLLAVLDAPKFPRTAELDTDSDNDAASRRVESDADAVQVMTVWVSKGLEFPIVLIPTMWSVSNSDVQYHDPTDGVRIFDASHGGTWPDKAASAERVELSRVEASAEQMRLLYVALTRARHHTALWWVRYRDGYKSALCRLLFARHDDGSIDTEQSEASRMAQPANDEIAERLSPLVQASGGHIEVVEHGAPVMPRPRWTDPERAATDTDLSAAELGRSLPRARSRWSFTAIKARDDDHLNPWDLSRGEEASDDEQRPPDAGLDTEPPVLPHPPSSDIEESSLAWLPAGASFGTLVHEVLEDVDFTEPDLATHVAEVVNDQMGWRALSLRPVGPVVEGQPVGGTGDELDDAEGARRLAAGLVEVIETPLGPLFDGRRLRDIGSRDCLDEMGFELPLNSEGGSASTVADIGRLLTERLPAGDPYRPWAEALADGTIRVHLDGHLTGSIDAVIRVNGRFVVVDYKSNRLHEHGRPPEVGDYGADSMRLSMFQHEYPLQALLYQVAVHRYLRWRQPAYAPETHLGGIAYLYVRGMTGKGVRTVDGAPDGVCTWRVPATVVEALSDLLDGLDSGGSR